MHRFCGALGEPRHRFSLATPSSPHTAALLAPTFALLEIASKTSSYWQKLETVTGHLKTLLPTGTLHLCMDPTYNPLFSLYKKSIIMFIPGCNEGNSSRLRGLP